MDMLLSLALLSVLHVVWTQQSQPLTINTYGSCASADAGLEKRIASLEAQVQHQQMIIDKLESGHNTGGSVRDCDDIFKRGNRSSGIYTIHPENFRPLKVFCDFNGEGLWTVVQRRSDGTTDFQRSWQEYKKGFGYLDHNMWLGNAALAAITAQRQYKLRIEITDWDDFTHYAEYKYFLIGGEDEMYAMHYANYSGTAGDSLAKYHNGMKFSTFDKDNDIKPDEHCASRHGGGWWYRECDHANLNGYYHYSPNLKGPTDAGIEWDSWKQLYSFKKTLMKIKPAFDV